MKTYWRLLGYLRPVSRYVVPFFLSSFFGSLFGVINFTFVIPLLEVLFYDKPLNVVEQLPAFELSTQYFADLFNYYLGQFLQAKGKLSALQFVCGAVLLSVFLSNTFRYLTQRILEGMRADLVARLRDDVFRNVVRLHLDFFSNQRKGNLITRITSDVIEVEYAVANSLKAFLKEPFILIISFTILFSISVKLTLFALLFIPVSGLIIGSIIKRLRHSALSLQAVLSNLTSVIDEAFGGIRIVKGFNAEDYMQEKFHKENWQYRHFVRKIAFRRELAPSVSEFMGVAVMCGVLLYGGSLILVEQSISAPLFLGYLAVLSQVTKPIKEIGNAVSAVQRGMASADRIFELIDTQPAIQDKPGARVLQSFEKEIRFEQVSFAYEEGVPVLNDLNFSIPKGKVVALVGPSGGGKSTIADLIPRFYDPTGGRITLDGVDLRDYTLKSLRAKMGIVTQESILFNDTIFNNIAFGMNVTPEQVEEAARIANAHDFIVALPEGYQTVVGDRGVKLSGGQRQRISIARAVLRNPDILILDEATSALDTESERLVQEALNKLMKHRTALVIAHRLSTIQEADEILVIQQGRIVERGTHENLIQQPEGLYKRLVEMQAL
jgi:subfamily B ATP-binding cassette protein MsbA